MIDINMKWVERLHAPRYIWSQIAALNLQRGILCREEKSQQRLLTWDVETGETRPLTPPVDYQLNATLSQDGEFVTYLVPHPTHADVYQYVRVPFGGGDPQPIALTALMNASPHIEEASGRIGFTAVTGNGYSVQIWTPDGKKPLFSYESEVLAYGPSLSFDGKIAVVATMQSAESETTHLEAYNIDTGVKIRQLALRDTPLEAVKFAPVLGNTRLTVQVREEMVTRSLIWDAEKGGFFGPNYGHAQSWDWINARDNREDILTYNREAEIFTFYLENDEDDIPLYAGRGHILNAYMLSPTQLLFHYEDIHGITLKSVGNIRNLALKTQVKDIKITLPQQSIVNSDILSFGVQPFPSWRTNSTQTSKINFRENASRVIGVTLNDENPSYAEIGAWVHQGVTYINAHLDEGRLHTPIWSEALEIIARASKHLENKLSPLPLLTAHNMGAALALVTLHHDSSLWTGGIIVRPILDWEHLYESVAPPEKAMMRLWFGGSPTERPDAWREASPLRQTTPLSVPVKLLYHPYDSLTPIQHIQTYAANNPTVELIDISRDMVGPAHEQQERLITRMLQVGLPLLQPGT